MERRIEVRQIINILALFLVVQFIGMLLITQITPQVLSETVGAPSNSGPVPTLQLYQILEYLIIIIIFTTILILVIKYVKRGFVFTAIEAFVVIGGSFLFFDILLSIFFPQAQLVDFVEVASIVIACILIAAKNKEPRLRNILTMISSIGIGIAISLFFGFVFVYLFIALVAIYDYVAVFITKHMVTLGREAVNRNLSLFVGSSDTEVMPSSYLSKSETKSLMKGIKVNEIKNPTLKHLVESGGVPMLSQVALGNGDLAIPLTLALSAYTNFVSPFLSLMIIIGAACGLTVTMLILKAYKFALPAIPPLFAFMSITAGIGLFVKGYISVFFMLALFAVAAFTMSVLMLTVKMKKSE